MRETFLSALLKELVIAVVCALFSEQYFRRSVDMTPCNQISTFVQQHRRNLPNYVQKVAVLIRDACIASFHAKSYHADSETLDSSPVFPSKLCVFDCIFGQKLTELKKNHPTLKYSIFFETQ